jgi:hypothetical protein
MKTRHKKGLNLKMSLKKNKKMKIILKLNKNKKKIIKKIIAIIFQSNNKRLVII